MEYPPLPFELELIGKSLLTSSIPTHKHELQSACSAIKLHLLAQATLQSDKLNLMPQIYTQILPSQFYCIRENYNKILNKQQTTSQHPPPKTKIENQWHYSLHIVSKCNASSRYRNSQKNLICRINHQTKIAIPQLQSLNFSSKATRSSEKQWKKEQNGTVNSLRDLEKPIRRLPVKEPSEQRHLMALFLRRSDPNRKIRTSTNSKKKTQINDSDPQLEEASRSRSFTIRRQIRIPQSLLS